jgi:hypothetical protein
MARGNANRQVASHQDFGGMPAGDDSLKSTADRRMRTEREHSDGSHNRDGNSASDTGNSSDASGKDGGSSAQAAPGAEQ